jgi:hypothetical protein
MTFVIGYKSNKKKPQIVAITKPEHINEINIVEIDYILLVSRNIPTHDEINHNKIIRIFVTDLAKNVYELTHKIKNTFLTYKE